MSWLVISIVLSIVLTVVLNAGLRLFPAANRRATQAVTKPDWSSADETRTSDRRIRVWTPWKAMILGSLMLTIVFNLVLWITRAQA